MLNLGDISYYVLDLLNWKDYKFKCFTSIHDNKLTAAELHLKLYFLQNIDETKNMYPNSLQ